MPKVVRKDVAPACLFAVDPAAVSDPQPAPGLVVCCSAAGWTSHDTHRHVSHDVNMQVDNYCRNITVALSNSMIMAKSLFAH